MPLNPDKSRIKEYTEGEYNQEKLFYYQNLFELEHTFQKNLLNTSLGTLVLSVTLFQIFQQQNISNLCLIIFSWIFLLISSYLSMKRFKDGQKEIIEAIKDLNYARGTTPQERFNDYSEKKRQSALDKYEETKFLDRIKEFVEDTFDNSSNWLSISFLSLGILFLITFSLTNI